MISLLFGKMKAYISIIEFKCMHATINVEIIKVVYNNIK